jgi:predicted RNase H-like HicB family nuclease
MTYTFAVLVEPDEDRWYAECPALVEQGGATWGYTRDEALANIEVVARMVVESLIEHGESVPESAPDPVQVTVCPRVAVTV